LSLTKDQDSFLKYARLIALEIGPSGRELTSIIGELAACQALNLHWIPSTGYDAICPDGKKVQIKTRKSWSTEKINPKGVLGRFGTKSGYEFDIGLYVELDEKFMVESIRQIDLAFIKEKEGSQSKKRGLHVSTVRKYSKEIWPKENQ